MLGAHSQDEPQAVLSELAEGDAGGAKRELRHITHKTIKKVTNDLERFHFNTMLATLMEFTNHLVMLRNSVVHEAKFVDPAAWGEAINTLLLLLAPTAPHLAEELWTRIGHTYSIHNQPFPKWDEELAREEAFTLVIQVNGKVRDRVSVPVTISETEARELALGRSRVAAHIRCMEIARIIYVPKRLVNIVAN